MSTRFAKYLQEFFIVRLMKERDASPETIASYKDAFHLLLCFLVTKLSKAPVKIELEDLDAPVISEFLQHLEDVRGNCARTRNLRLAAIRSFFHYVSFQEPRRAFSPQIMKVKTDDLRAAAGGAPRGPNGFDAFPEGVAEDVGLSRKVLPSRISSTHLKYRPRPVERSG